jgi:ACR3 family arsenite efflux pump ArsB
MVFSLSPRAAPALVIGVPIEVPVKLMLVQLCLWTQRVGGRTTVFNLPK